MNQSKHLLLVSQPSSPQSVCSTCSVPGLVDNSWKRSSKNPVQEQWVWCAGQQGHQTGTTQELDFGPCWGVTVGPLGVFCDSLNGTASNAASSPAWLSCRARVSAGRNMGDGVERLRQVRAFCFSTPGAEHSHLRCSSTAALCPHHPASHCQVYTHTLWSNTTSQLLSFGPGSIIWAGFLVLVLQMPFGQRQYLWAECKTRPTALQVLHTGQNTH